jgi:hypothetical protein
LWPFPAVTDRIRIFIAVNGSPLFIMLANISTREYNI